MKKLEKSGSKYTEIYTEDEKEHGNTYHKYTISGKINENIVYLTRFNFQNGPVKENGLNGIFIEDLLEICKHRLECFQDGEFKCKENERALTHIKLALDYLNKRTEDRELRDVEGTSNV